MKTRGNGIKIINLKSNFLNTYILRHEAKGCIVIDTGYPGEFNKFVKNLHAAGIALKEIRFIFLTHSHEDHAGFLNELVMHTDAQVVLHKQAVQRLETGQQNFRIICPTRRAQLACKMMAIFGSGKRRHMSQMAGIRDRCIIVDGKYQPFLESGIQATVLMLPGHTGDSIGLLLADGSLFCGDAAMNGFPSIARHPLWIEDLQELTRSWDVMLEYEPEKIYPAHGRPFEASDLKKYKYYFQGKKLYFHPSG